MKKLKICIISEYAYSMIKNTGANAGVGTVSNNSLFLQKIWLEKTMMLISLVLGATSRL